MVDATGEAVARFPARYAATRRFTLGHPRNLTVSPDGERVVFLRARTGDDPSTGLWTLQTQTATERLLVDPAQLGADETRLPPEERRRRERVRESAAGVVAYATDEEVTRAVTTVGGALYLVDLESGQVVHVPVPQAIADARLDPSGEMIAVAAEGGVGVVQPSAVAVTPLIADDDPDVTWGLAEFVAAEEMGRTRGFWWSPDGAALAVARVDARPVQRWYLADPSNPAVPPAEVRYPAAGTANAGVSLHIVSLQGQAPVPVDWDRGFFPYLATVSWEPHTPLTLVVQSRDQRTLRILTVDSSSGATTVMHEAHDRFWVDLVAGVPRWLPDGRLVTTFDDDDTRGLSIDGRMVTPPELQVHSVAGVTSDAVIAVASTDPVASGVWRIPISGDEPVLLTRADGVAGAVVGGDTVVVTQRRLDRPGVETIVHSPQGDSPVRSVAERPQLAPRVEFLRLGERDLRAALVLPAWWRESDGRLPVLLDPYGGPHAQRVVAASDAYLVPQWFAEHGFAVLIIDGRGTPGRGPAWERAIAGDLAGPALEDQISGLRAAGEQHPAIDRDRVAIRGWSFGGFLAALAVLRQPDDISAAIAGAPVTDWSLYDTHYTERYLGDPAEHPEAYQRSSLLADAASLRRPLLLIHGLTDDNVVAAHTLRLSAALFEAGRPHSVLPLSGVTHMTPAAVTAENLLHVQLAFLRDALGVAGGR